MRALLLLFVAVSTRETPSTLPPSGHGSAHDGHGRYARAPPGNVDQHQGKSLRCLQVAVPTAWPREVRPPAGIVPPLHGCHRKWQLRYGYDHVAALAYVGPRADDAAPPSTGTSGRAATGCFRWFTRTHRRPAMRPPVSLESRHAEEVGEAAVSLRDGVERLVDLREREGVMFED